MKFERFRQLVIIGERIAARHPIGFRWLVVALTAGGYAYLLLVGLALLGLTVLSVYLAVGMGVLGPALLAVPALYALDAVIRAVSFRTPRPTGLEVPLDSVPELAHLLDDLRRRCEGPRVHRLLLQVEMGAGVTQHGRWGGIGGHENALHLGIPLLQAFPRDEVTAILAHELAHLNGGHGRLGGWVARQWATFSRLDVEVRKQRRRIGRWILTPMTHLYLPFYNACAFALRRQQEYDADRFAAAVAGPRSMGRALARLAVVDRWKQEVRDPGLRDGALAGASPPPAIFNEYPARLAAEAGSQVARDWTIEALQRPTDYTDSHPALRDRLVAIGHDLSGPPPEIRWDVPGTPGLSLLAPRAEELLALGNHAWLQAAGPALDALRKQALQLTERLEAIAGEPGPISPGHAWERAQLIEQRDGSAAALPDARRVLEGEPGHVGARFLIVRALLAAGDEKGLEELERLTMLAPDLVRPAGELAFGFLWARGRRTEAESWRQRWVAREALRAQAIKERRNVSRNPPLSPHRLQPEEVERIREGLSRITGVSEIYLARRVVRYAPEIPCYLVGVRPQIPWYRPTNVKELRALSEAVLKAAPWPHETRVVPLAMELKGLRGRMRRIEGSLMYPRPTR